MSFTRKDLRQRIGGVEFCNDTLVSAASGNGSTTTLVDTSQKQPDDWWNYSEVVFISGTAGNIGLYRYVTDWVQSTSTFTLDRAVTSTATADGYEVHRIFPYTEKNAAINAAINASGYRWCRTIEDTSITLDDETYHYSLSALTSTMDPNLGLDDIRYDPDMTTTGVSGTGYPFSRISNSFWDVRFNGTMATLQFLTRPPIDNQTLRLVYRVRPSTFSDDTTILQPDDAGFASYICSKATAILFRARALKEPEGAWTEKAVQMEQLAEGFYSLDSPRQKPKPVKSEFLLWGK